MATSFFALEHTAFNDYAIARIPAMESPQVLTSIADRTMLDATCWVMTASAGETIVVPAGLAATHTGRRGSLLMRGWVPGLERDVIAPARLAGATRGQVLLI